VVRTEGYGEEIIPHSPLLNEKPFSAYAISSEIIELNAFQKSSFEE